MKKLRIAVLLVTVISLVGLFLACPSGGSSSTPPVDTDETPVATDFTITGTGNFVDIGTPQFVDVVATPKSGKSTGAITYNYYNATGDKVAKPAPTAVGTYSVTFDVAASTGWKAGVGLSAGFVSISISTDLEPDILDFTITGFPVNIAEGDPAPAVSITAKSGKTTGTITIVYKDKDGNSTTGNATGSNMPTAAGMYSASFNVAAATGWRSKNGFDAGYVYIRKPEDPTEPIQVTVIDFNDFTFIVGPTGNNVDTFTTTSLDVPYQNIDLPVRVAVKSIPDRPPYPLATRPATVQYWDGDTMIGVPKTMGTYTVKISFQEVVDVEGRKSWSALNLELTLNVTIRTPKADDFDITKKLQSAAGSFLTNVIKVEHVRIDPKTANTDLNGPITIIYTAADGAVITAPPDNRNPANNNYIAPPQTAGTYAVTFKVAASTGPGADNWGATTTDLIAGDLVVKPLQPVNPSYTGYLWFDEDVLKAPAAWYNNTNKRYEYVLTVSQLPVTIGMVNGAIDSKVVGWKADGKDVEPNDDGSYTFNKTAVGWHWVTLVVRTEDTPASGANQAVRGKLYSETVYIRVQP